MLLTCSVFHIKVRRLTVELEIVVRHACGLNLYILRSLCLNDDLWSRNACLDRN